MRIFLITFFFMFPGVICAQKTVPVDIKPTQIFQQRIDTIKKNPKTIKMTKKSFGTKNPSALTALIVKTRQK